MEQPRLVGRGPECRALDRWLDAAQDGNGRLVLIAGEPGIGKTSLVSTFAHTAATRVPVAWGNSMEHVSAAPLRPWRQIAAALGGADRLEVDRRTDPVGERFARFDAFAAWLVDEAARHGGAVIVVEDIHAADEATLHLLEAVAGATAGTALLLVTTYRDVEHDQAPGFPAVLDTLGRLRNTERLHVRGLDRSAVADLIGANGLAAAVRGCRTAPPRTGRVPADTARVRRVPRPRTTRDLPVHRAPLGRDARGARARTGR